MEKLSIHRFDQGMNRFDCTW